MGSSTAAFQPASATAASRSASALEGHEQGRTAQFAKGAIGASDRFAWSQPGVRPICAIDDDPGWVRAEVHVQAVFLDDPAAGANRHVEIRGLGGQILIEHVATCPCSNALKGIRRLAGRAGGRRSRIVGGSSTGTRPRGRDTHVLRARNAAQQHEEDRRHGSMPRTLAHHADRRTSSRTRCRLLPPMLPSCPQPSGATSAPPRVAVGQRANAELWLTQIDCHRASKVVRCRR
jgi:hypothetical protein